LSWLCKTRTKLWQMLQMPDIIFDTMVISNFAKAGQLELLQSLYSANACCSGFVVAEILRGVRQGHVALKELAGLLSEGWPRQEDFKTQAERQLYASISVSLGDGESSCLALAAQRGYVFACDDRLARSEAVRLSVPLTGTVGILIKAVRVGAIDLKKANSILKRMIHAGFYAPMERITTAMV
jgi:predicted nucleic acid-binding protein